MGARRYGPDFGRFLQQDMFAGALANLGLALDPLTQNRYALAGGNPISYIEFDGHMVVADGGGGGSPSASPPPPPPPPSDQGGWEGLKRFGSQVGKNLWESAKGTGNLIGTSFRCEYTDNQEGCDEFNDQLEHQFTTKEGWQSTWNSLKEPFEQDCNPDNNRAPECAAHVATALLEVLGGKGLGRANILGKACSFAGETLVLMADGSTKPISEVKVGDEVMATDPETGEKGARTVTQVWVHKDELVKLELDGHLITTTEDHPFWNETDKQWQRADELDPGDAVRSATGQRIRVDGVRNATAHTALAYNLTVDDIHTFFVLAAERPVLVHNDHACRWQIRNPDGTIRDSGNIDSGSRTPPGRRLNWTEQLTTHTEYKLMEDLRGTARPGDIITLQGTLPPCNPGGRGCQFVMSQFANQHRVKIIYRQQGVADPWVWDGR